MSIHTKISNYLFAPRFHFNRFQFNLVALLCITLGFVAGMYVVLTEAIPKILALNDTAKVWTLSAATAGTFTTSQTVVDNSGAHPTGGQVGANELANPAFATDIASWSSAALAPSGWVEVPSNALYNPPTGNFLVMQYEAKYDCTATPDGIGDTAATCSAPADSGAGLDYRDIAGFSTSRVVSTANGAPIVHITQTQALSACPTGSHLISNAEWMTIARNAEAQAANWANNTPNSTVASGGGLKRGNVGLTDSASYDGADPEQGTGRNTKAKLALSSGAELWDLSGNVWEWNSDTIMAVNKPHNNTGAWVEWTVFTPPGASTYGSLSYDLTRPANSSLNADYGIGRYYQGPNTGGPYAFLRGGSWA